MLEIFQGEEVFIYFVLLCSEPDRMGLGTAEVLKLWANVAKGTLLWNWAKKTHVKKIHLKQFLPEVFFIEFSKLSERFAIGKYCNGKCNAFNILHVCSVR